MISILSGFGAVNYPFACCSVFLRSFDMPALQQLERRQFQILELISSKKKRLLFKKRDARLKGYAFDSTPSNTLFLIRCFNWLRSLGALLFRNMRHLFCRCCEQTVNDQKTKENDREKQKEDLLSDIAVLSNDISALELTSKAIFSELHEHVMAKYANFPLFRLCFHITRTANLVL
jgi:hypothetical protein